MGRDIKSDNIKGILIFFVVLGHIIGASKEGLENIVNFIYSFHMPAFIFISGYFSKNPNVRKIINLSLLYLIFQSFYSVLRYYTGDFPSIQFTFCRPHTHLWYIVSLGFWYSLALILKRLPFGRVFNALLVCGLLILSFYSRLYADGAVEAIKLYYENMHTQTLSILRTFVFLPFFFAGFYLNGQTLKRIYCFLGPLKNYKYLIMFIYTVLIMHYISAYPKQYDLLFYGFLGYERFALENQSYSLTVLFQYLAGAAGIFFILNAAGEKSSILTRWGEYSLSIFLFHMVVVFYLISQPEWLDQLSPDVRLFAEFGIALGVTFILGSAWFNHYVKYLIHPLNTVTSIMRRIMK
ncbi:acyltransferase family protein [Bacillus sp. 7894-2]|uniref:acyltransferase family protein n=1 Tax=Bacillus sp. 7894-2 TaxID=2021695 RepID=UPI000BA50FF7|nr:acyltransferase family protein [Bacillus sp. 7894-2]PAE25818.1 hypothetical protein CHI10_05925 [Bacillus sp. 7894-2]